MSLPHRRLLQAMESLDQAEAQGGIRALAAISYHLDEWLAYDQPIVLPSGEVYPETGFRMAVDGDRGWWLLRGGRLLQVSEGLEGAGPRVAPLVELDLDAAALARYLRPHVIRWYLSRDLAGLAGAEAQVAINDLVTAAFEAGPESRAAILAALAEAMVGNDGWAPAGLRLRAAFERALADRAPAVRLVAARALVAMATGRAPGGPRADPQRELAILLRMPRADVREASLSALLDSEPEALTAVAEGLGPLLVEVMARPEADLRRMAGRLQMRLEGRSEALAISEGLSSEDRQARREAAEQLQREAQNHFDVLMPRLLEALDDPDPELRRVSLQVIREQIEAAPPELRRRVLIALLGSTEARAVAYGVHDLEQRLPEGAETLRDDGELTGTLLRALDHGPEPTRPDVARLWYGIHRDADPDTQVEVLRRLLQHEDLAVRRAALAILEAGPLPMAALREGLFKILVEVLSSPEPQLQLAAAKAVLAQGYPHADDIVGGLVFDLNPELRRAVVEILRREEAQALTRVEALAARVDRVVAGLDDPGGHGPESWIDALRGLVSTTSPRLPGFLLAVLGRMTAEPQDPAQARMLEEVDAQLRRLAPDGDDLISLSRRLLEPPHPRPGHATRLAAGIAAEDLRAFHFLWACMTLGQPELARHARQALLSLPVGQLAGAVKTEVTRLLRGAEDPQQRQVLARLAGRG